MLDKDILLKAYTLMCYVQYMSETYENNRTICKYVHSTSKGHEAIQLATAFQLLPQDYISPYYRDESILLGLGFTPYELMLQLLAKQDDIFSGGRSYYNHPSYKGKDKPTIIHQSSATGMQVIPTTGIAMGLKSPPTPQRGDLVSHKANLYDRQLIPVNENLLSQPFHTLVSKRESPVVICSLGDASITEGEVSEALQFAVLKQLPIIYLVQDNDWGISVTAKEARAMNAFEYAAGFKGLQRIQVDGSDFEASYDVMEQVINDVRENNRPWLVQANVPLLGHHTSGVRKEFYRTEEDLVQHDLHNPFRKLHLKLLSYGIPIEDLNEIKNNAQTYIVDCFAKACAAPEPTIVNVEKHVFAQTPITVEKGIRAPQGKEKIMMVDAALFAIREIMEKHDEVILYGQDVGKRLGGVFREAATLADQFGEHRVFNTAIQEAFIIGSTIGLCAVGIKPIVEVQFADYIYPGLNQLVTEISKSNYLSNGKFPIQMLLRVPCGAYGGGGPYHSGSIESTLLTIKGIKIVYPSNAADMKGLMKAAFYDPNPVIMLEHKGLYWSKVPGTEDAKTVEPDEDYIIPLGKANMVCIANEEKLFNGETCLVITYGMGVYWAKAAATQFDGAVEIMDLRTLFPLDEELIFAKVKEHGKCLIVTEEQQNNSFAEALSGRISKKCFSFLDAPVDVIGALNLPAVPINIALEKAMLPNADKVAERIKLLLSY
jgi:2-oxoisovalerate dehydrogenase E1 component